MLRCKYLFKFGDRPRHPKHGRSTVWWVGPDHCSALRFNGVTYITAGRGVPDVTIASHVVPAVDPVVVIAIDAREVSDELVEAMRSLMDDGRVLILVGPRCPELMGLPLTRAKGKRMATVDIAWDRDGTPSAEARYL
jgi:hypothetical protein